MPDLYNIDNQSIGLYRVNCQVSERSPQTDTCGGKNKPTELKIGNS
jgi:hypothetical protein